MAAAANTAHTIRRVVPGAASLICFLMTFPPVRTLAIDDRWLTLDKMAAAQARFPGYVSAGGSDAINARLLPPLRDGCAPSAGSTIPFFEQPPAGAAHGGFTAKSR
jgi:acyl dehydratase